MNPKTTLVMGGALVAMVAIIAVLKLANVPTDEEKAKRRDKVIQALANVEPDSATEVTLKRGNDELHFVHSEDGDRWQMKKPADVLADGSRVRAIVSDLKSLARRTGSRGKDNDKADTVAVKSNASLAQYGLDTPAKTVTLTFKPKGSDKKTETVTLQVGGPTADKDGLYVKRPDEPIVFVVNKTSLDSLDKKVNEFRQQKLLTISRWDSDQVHLEWPDRKIHAEKQDSKWRLVEPLQDRAESAKVEELITKLADLKADGDDDYVDDNAADLAKYGLDKPALVAEVRKPASSASSFGADKKKDKTKDKDKPAVVEKILIGKPVEGKEDKVYAKLADQKNVIAVSASVLKDLDKQPSDLRSHDLVEVTQADVDYVSIERAGTTVALGKRDFEWELFKPKTVKAEKSAIDELVKKIDDLNISEFLDDADPKEYDLDKPAVTVSLYQKGLKSDDKDKDAKDSDKKDKKDEKKDDASAGPPEPTGTPIQVSFGKRDEEKKLIYVKRGEAKGVFAVSDDGLWDLLNRDHLAYRDKKIPTFGDKDVAKLTVHRDGKTFSVERKKEKEADFERDVWRMTEPVDAAADSGSVSSILFRFANLNVKKFIEEGASGEKLKPYGLDEPKIRATATLKADGDKKPEHVLLIGSEVEGDGGYYAMLAGGDLVFSVEPTMFKNLTAELHDRTVLKFDPTKVEGITLTWPDAKLELANKKPDDKSPKEWSIVGETDLKLDTRKPQDLLSLLATLSADSFAQYKDDFTEPSGLDKPALLVEIKLDGENDAKTLRIGAASDGKRHVATAEKSGPVALIAEDRVKDWLTGPKQFAQPEEKKPEPAKPDEAKKDEGKPDEKKPDDKKPDGDKPQEKKPSEKPDSKPEDKKSDEKKPEGKPDEKKPADEPKKEDKKPE